MDSNVGGLLLSHSQQPWLCLYTSPLQATKTAEILRACKLERFEDTLMDKQPSNVNFYDDMDKWLELPTQDEPRGESATNGGVFGGFESTEENEYAWEPIPGRESECMAIRIAGEL